MEKIYSKDWYISSFKKFEENLNGEAKSELHKIRKNAINLFSETGFPSTKVEDWKYTKVSPIFNHEFTADETDLELSSNDISKYQIEGLKTNRLVFINGRFNEKLSSSLKNVIFFTLDFFPLFK